MQAMADAAYVNTPLEIILNSTLANSLLNLNQYQEALRCGRRALKMVDRIDHTRDIYCECGSGGGGGVGGGGATKPTNKPPHEASTNQSIKHQFNHSSAIAMSALRFMITTVWMRPLSINSHLCVYTLHMIGPFFIFYCFSTNQGISVTTSVAELKAGIYLTLTHAYFALHCFDQVGS
jgi:hypothetical protein